MFKYRKKILTLFGFSVYIDPSWLIIAGLVIWSLARGLFPAWYPGYPSGVYVAMGICGALLLILSVTWHELCHSLVARRFGMPMEGITLFIFGGIAEMNEEPPSPRAEFMMAVAGPVSSLLLAWIFVGATVGVRSLGAPAWTYGVLHWAALLNAILAIFNLFPGFPLDGGRALRAVLWGWRGSLRWATRVVSQIGAGFGMVLVVLGFLNLLLGNALGGLWWILIGLFIRSAAQGGYQQLLVRKAFEGELVKDFMNQQPVLVPSDTTVDDLINDYIYRYQHKFFPVTENGNLYGAVHFRQVKEVPVDERSRRTVAEIAQRVNDDNCISPEADTMDAFAKMRKTGASRLLVVDEGRLQGILALKDLLSFLQLKLELDEGESVPFGSEAPSGREDGMDE